MKTFDVYNQFDINPVKAKDEYVYDKKNNKYLDLYGGHAVISIGHTEKTMLKILLINLIKLVFTPMQ